jgi:GntR family transcriptional regulator
MYHQIARSIQNRIYQGIYQPGDPIPTEKELSREFGVARLTVRDALRDMILQGVLIARRGSGTYVSATLPVVRPVNFIGFLDDMFLQPFSMDTAVVRVEEIAPPEVVRSALQLAEDEKVLVTELIRGINGQPTRHVTLYLPARFERNFDREKLGNTSIPALIEKAIGRRLSNSTQTLSAEGAPADIATHLQLSLGAPVLKSEYVLSDSEDPISMTVVRDRSDQRHFTATLIYTPQPMVSESGESRTANPAQVGQNLVVDDELTSPTELR